MIVACLNKNIRNACWTRLKSVRAVLLGGRGQELLIPKPSICLILFKVVQIGNCYYILPQQMSQLNNIRKYFLLSPCLETDYGTFKTRMVFCCYPSNHINWHTFHTHPYSPPRIFCQFSIQRADNLSSCLSLISMQHQMLLNYLLICTVYSIWTVHYGNSSLPNLMNNFKQLAYMQNNKVHLLSEKHLSWS